MIYVSRKEHFNAAHRLWNPNWSEAHNFEVFGKCANPHFHGHNFEVVVTVAGELDPETGFVVDMKKLGDVIQLEVVEALDHKNLNLDVPFLEGKMTSCEVLVIEIWNILEPQVNNLTKTGKLYSIKLIETKKNFVEYRG